MSLRIASLLGSLAFLLVIVLLLWRLDHVTQEREIAQDKLYKAEQALKELETSKDNQVAALEQVAEKARQRASSLQSKLVKLVRENEKVKCPMPTFMRDAFRGVQHD